MGYRAKQRAWLSMRKRVHGTEIQEKRLTDGSRPVGDGQGGVEEGGSDSDVGLQGVLVLLASGKGGASEHGQKAGNTGEVLLHHFE